MFSGIASSFSQPARQSLMPSLVPRADLPAAVACNSLCFNVARFVGPAIAGPLIAIGGVLPAVLLNCCAYLIATFTMPLLRIDRPSARGHAPGASVWAEAIAGFRYAGRHPGIGPLLGFAAVASILMRGRAGNPAALRRAAVPRGAGRAGHADRLHRHRRAVLRPVGGQSRAG